MEPLKMKLIRQVIETHKPNYMKFLFQGEVIDEDYVCPTTVKIYTLWKNYNGEDRIGPEITGPSPESPSQIFKEASKGEHKLRLNAAVRLTKLFRETHDDRTSKR